MYTGRYVATNGTVIEGPSVADLIAENDASVDKELRVTITSSLAAANQLVVSAEKEGIAYDELLAEGNTAGNAKILGVVNALLEQTQSIEKAVVALNISPIEFEGSDSLDAPKEVFK